MCKCSVKVNDGGDEHEGNASRKNGSTQRSICAYPPDAFPRPILDAFARMLLVGESSLCS